MSFKPYKPREYASTKDVVTRLIDQAGGIKRAAFVLERSPTQTLAYSDPATADQISFDQVRHLVAATDAIAAAEDLAALAGGVFLPAPAPNESFDMLAAEGARDWGEFTAALLRARAEKRLHKASDDPVLKGGDLLRRLDKLINALATARASLHSHRLAAVRGTEE